MNKIDTIRFGIAGGLIDMFVVFSLTILAATSGFGHGYLSLLKDLFPGYKISIVGSLVGAGYTFGIGFIKFFILAYIYNLLGKSGEED